MHHEAHFDALNRIIDVVVDSVYGLCIGDVELLIRSLHHHGLHIGVEAYKGRLVHAEMHPVAICILESIECNILQCRHLRTHLDSYLIVRHLNRCVKSILDKVLLIGVMERACIRKYGFVIA